MSDVVKRDLYGLIDKELEAANQKFPLFNSTHEAFAVILEEAEEAKEEAVEWCKARGLTFDTVNANLPELIDLYKNDCRKINADIYIDDKAVNPVPYRHAAGMFGFNPYANPIDKAEFEKRRSNHVEKN